MLRYQLDNVRMSNIKRIQYLSFEINGFIYVTKIRIITQILNYKVQTTSDEPTVLL